MNTLSRKLSSRKLWAAIAVYIAGIAAAFSTYLPETARVAGMVGAIATGIAYILGESHIDAASVSVPSIDLQTYTVPGRTDEPCENLGITETEYEK